MNRQKKFWEKDPHEEHVEDKLVAMSRPGTTNQSIQFIQNLNQISYAPLAANLTFARPYRLTPLEEKIVNIF